MYYFYRWLHELFLLCNKEITLFAAMVFNGSIGALQALGAGSNPVRCSICGYSTTVSVGDFQSSDVGSIPITRSII